MCEVWCTVHSYKVSVRPGVQCAPSSSSVYTKQSSSSPLSSRYTSVQIQRYILHPRSPSLHSLGHLEPPPPPPPPRPATSKKRLEAGAGPRHGYTSDSADSLHRAASCERNVALLLLTQGILMGHPDILIYSILQCN